jgi:2-amino-4-hydroxy-6-hydroxymethyldihydropteridine diphosphokinase
LKGRKQAKKHQVILGLGSNISPAENLKSGLYLLGQITSIESVSKIWQTRAVGSKGPDFLNAAVRISTPLTPDELRNQVIRPIENFLGRERTKDPNSPRTIDVDILIFDGKILDPDIWNYAHLCVPLSQLLPNFSNPATGETIKTTADRFLQSNSINLYSLERNWLSSP